MSVSGLNSRGVRDAQRNVQLAAVEGLHHAAAMHYTMGGRRWSGITDHRRPDHHQFPIYSDCSAFATWCLWWALHVKHGLADHVNGTGWQGGYTGTLLKHGQTVHGGLQPGDLVIYGHHFPGEHVAVYTGGGDVVSHGSEGGPYLLPVRYRSDVLSIKRYI